MAVGNQAENQPGNEQIMQLPQMAMGSGAFPAFYQIMSLVSSLQFTNIRLFLCRQGGMCCFVKSGFYHKISLL